MRDSISEKIIEGLHPKARPLVKAFIEECEDAFNITLRIVQGFRTFSEQDHLYAQGRTAPGNIVTHAKGGQSYHCFGLAIDIVPIHDEVVNGKADWNWNFSKFAPIAKKYGFTWGHAWNDNDHFELDFGHGPSGWKYFLSLYNEHELDAQEFVIFSETFTPEVESVQETTTEVASAIEETPTPESSSPQASENEIIKNLEGDFKLPEDIKIPEA